MRNMAGHPNSCELKFVNRLEASINVESSPIQKLLELGQLYIEPCHRETDAISIFEVILRRDPNNSSAKFWLAYCCIHYLMDNKSLQRAVSLLNSVITYDHGFVGAAFMLLAEALNDVGNFPLNDKIRLLESSVSYEPNWVYNRYYLALAYKQNGYIYDAMSQLQRALQNVMVDKPQYLDINTRYFEESITGRMAHKIKEKITNNLREYK
jgi:tetratricopeptide (TPR) repeat protein